MAELKMELCGLNRFPQSAAYAIHISSAIPQESNWNATSILKKASKLSSYPSGMESMLRSDDSAIHMEDQVSLMLHPLGNF